MPEIAKEERKMKTLEVKISDNLYKEIKSLVKMKIFNSESEVVNRALIYLLSEQSREFLRNLVKDLGITEKEMLKTLQKVRE